MTLTQITATGIVRTTVEQFVTGVAAAIPKVVSGLVFLVLAYVGVRIVLALVRAAFGRIYRNQRLVVDLFTLVVAIFLWFGVALAFLKIVGMGDIAASLGTAAGFAALGIAYALSNAIADTVAGVYLLRDPDFQAGDRVTAVSTTGTVTTIGLRKSRLETDGGDTVVLANREVENRWTKMGPPADAEDA